MNVADTSAWIEYFEDGPNQAYFAHAIQDSENLIVPSICIYETFKIVFRKSGEAQARSAVAEMRHARPVIELSESLALSAAKISLEYGLAMADSIVYATARKYSATLWTQDVDFQNLPGVNFVPKVSP